MNSLNLGQHNSNIMTESSLIAGNSLRRQSAAKINYRKVINMIKKLKDRACTQERMRESNYRNILIPIVFDDEEFILNFKS